MGSENGNCIILIGFMGCGKTTVGKKLAEQTGMPFLDTDDLIVQQEGCSVAEIFEKRGEPYFRDLETGVLRRLLEEKVSCVLAVGGGLPVREENRTLMRRLGTVIYLTAETETLVRRLEKDTGRPLLKGGNSLRERIGQLMAQRGRIYRDAADREIATDGLTKEETARRCAQSVKQSSPPAAG